MALQSSSLKSDLLAIFNKAKSSPMTEEEYAGQLAEAITKHIKTAAVPSGSVIIAVAGQATGTPNPSPINVQ
jgi:hypothetical protein